MSQTNIQGSNIDFNISLISANLLGLETLREAESFSIDTGIISYLEIEENLVDVGIKGYISLRNRFGLLDRIKALRDSAKSFFIEINYEETTSKSQLIDRRVSFVGLIENSSSLTSDVINDNIILRFEEAQTAMLKKASLAKLPSTSFGDITPNLHIKKLITLWNENIAKARLSDILSDDENIYNTIGNNVTSDIRSFWTNVTDSIYDVIERAKLTILMENRKLPILKIENVDGGNSIKRIFTLKELFSDRHREFLDAYTSNKSGDFKDVYMEEFTIVPENNTNPSNASLYNEVEKYNLIRSDVKSARENFWCDHMVVGHGVPNEPVDLVKTQTPIISFSEIVDNFEETDLGIDRSTDNIFSNTPVLRRSERKLIDIPETEGSGTSRAIIENRIFNKVKNSLVFLNDTIIFKVKGQVYRKPGTFISITGGDVISNKDKKLANIWFVISVKHLFKEMDYESEIIAVRLFGNDAIYSELAKEQVG